MLRAGLDEDQARKYADCRHNCRCILCTNLRKVGVPPHKEQKEDAKWEADIMWREEYRGHPYE